MAVSENPADPSATKPPLSIAAAAFAAILYAVVSGDGIVTALTGIVQRALTATF